MSAAPAALPDGTIASFVVLGAPRTKKNSMRIVGGPRARLIQSAAAMRWADGAVLQLRSGWRGRVPLAAPVNLAARVYRDRATGDLGNYLAAVCDALERAGVVVNDRWITQFDGSRLLVDKRNPRVEIVLTRL